MPKTDDLQDLRGDAARALAQLRREKDLGDLLRSNKATRKRGDEDLIDQLVRVAHDLQDVQRVLDGRELIPPAGSVALQVLNRIRKFKGEEPLEGGTPPAP